MGKTHPVNGDVIIDKDGVWGGDTLPLLNWEDASRRVVLPPTLVQHLPIAIPILRWSSEKLKAIATTRTDVLVIVDQLSLELGNWSIVGVESLTGNRRVLFNASDGRSYAFSFGPDKNDNWNAITIVGSSNPGFWTNRMRGLVYVRTRR